MIIVNKVRNLQVLLSPPKTSIDSNLIANSPFWLTDNKKREVGNVENLKNWQPS